MHPLLRKNAASADKTATSSDYDTPDLKWSPTGNTDRQMAELFVDGKSVGKVDVIFGEENKMPKGVAQTEGLEIWPEAQGKGYAVRLYTAVIDSLRAQGYTELWSSDIQTQGGEGVWAALKRKYPVRTIENPHKEGLHGATRQAIKIAGPQGEGQTQHTNHQQNNISKTNPETPFEEDVAKLAVERRSFKNTYVVVRVSGDAKEKVLQAAATIPDEELGPDGREDDPHVTIKFGCKDDPELLRATLEGVTPFGVKLGKLKVFIPSESSDRAAPVVAEAFAPQLKILHDKVDAAMSVREDDFPYNPHATLAYVKAADAKKYEGSSMVEGLTFVVDRVILSRADRTKVEILLMWPDGGYEDFPVQDVASNVKTGAESFDLGDGFSLSRTEGKILTPNQKKLYEGSDSWAVTNEAKQQIGEVSVLHYPQIGGASINTISLNEKYQRKGLGRKIIQALAKVYGKLTSDPQRNTSDAAKSMWRGVPGVQEVVAPEQFQHGLKPQERRLPWETDEFLTGGKFFVLQASHKTPPMSDTQYEPSENAGEEKGSYTEVPERVKGQREEIPLEVLNPGLFKQAEAQYVLYHGTTVDAARKIQAVGFQSEKHATWLIFNKPMAMYYAGMKARKAGQDKAALVMVDGLRAGWPESWLKSAKESGNSLVSQLPIAEAIIGYETVNTADCPVQMPSSHQAAAAKITYNFADMETEDQPLDDAWLLANKVQIHISRDKEVLVYASAGQKVVGALFVNEGQDNFAFDIVVDPAYQGKGIGSRLVKYAENEYQIRKQAFGDDYKIQVDVVNPTMKRILESQGYHVEENRGTDTWTMSKTAKGKLLGEVYLLHFNIEPGAVINPSREDAKNPFHARHYLGWAENAESRIQEHEQGTAARLTQHLKSLGIGFQVAKVWKDVDRDFERRLKNQGGLSRHCPICQQLGIDRESIGRKRRMEKASSEISFSNSLKSGGGLHVESEAGAMILEPVEDNPKALFVSGIELNEGFAGRGEGQRLYDAAILWMKRHGYLYLYSSNENNMSEDADKAWGRLSKRYQVEDVGGAFRLKIAGDLDGVVTGPLDVVVWRTGPLEDWAGRGIYFGGDKKDAEAYQGIHNDAEILPYRVQARNAYVTKGQGSLMRELFNKAWGDEVYKTDIGRFKGGDSPAAARFLEAKMVKELKKRGHDALVYLSPAAPARTELAAFGAKITPVDPKTITAAAPALDLMAMRKPCPSGKKKFFDEASVIQAFRHLPIPPRGYKCPQCGWFHLTSWSKDRFEQSKKTGADAPFHPRVEIDQQGIDADGGGYYLIEVTLPEEEYVPEDTHEAIGEMTVIAYPKADPPHLEIHEVEVLEHRRRMGVGTLLYKAAKRIARRLKLKEIWSDTPERGTSDAAKGVWESMGVKPGPDGRYRMKASVKTAFKIEVPKGARGHFWEEPPEGNLEFWAYRHAVSCLPGEKIIFTFDGAPIAQTVCHHVEGPGASKCENTGKYEKHHKVYWDPKKFVRLDGKTSKLAYGVEEDLKIWQSIVDNPKSTKQQKETAQQAINWTKNPPKPVYEDDEPVQKSRAPKKPKKLTKSYLEGVAWYVRNEVAPEDADGRCQEVSDAIVEELHSRGFTNAYTAHGQFRGDAAHPHAWVVVDGWEIDATQDQFAAYFPDDASLEDIYVGKPRGAGHTKSGRIDQPEAEWTREMQKLYEDTRKERLVLKHMRDKAPKSDRVRVKMVDPQALIPTQDVKDVEESPSYSRDSMPEVVALNGKLYIADGHHRVSEDINAGKTQIPVILISKAAAVAPAMSLQKQLESLRPQMVQVAQKVYDENVAANVENPEEEHGICDEIAQEISGVIASHLGDLEIWEGGQEGDDHAWVIAFNSREAFGIDIPPGVYESGGGYSWKLHEGVVFEPNDVEIWPMEVPEEYRIKESLRENR